MKGKHLEVLVTYVCKWSVIVITDNYKHHFPFRGITACSVQTVPNNGEMCLEMPRSQCLLSLSLSLSTDTNPNRSSMSQVILSLNSSEGSL